MPIKAPHFELHRVYDGKAEAGIPEIHPVLGVPGDTQMGRRDFLGAGMAIGGVVAAGMALHAASRETRGQFTRNPSSFNHHRGSDTKAHGDRVNSITISANGKWLVSGSGDKTIKVWSMPEGKLNATLAQHEDSVTGVALSPDDKCLATASHDKTIKLWTIPAGKPYGTRKGHDEPVNAVACSSDGRWLATASQDKTIRLWSMPAGRMQGTFDGHGSAVLSVAFTPDRNWLASGSSDRTVRLWSMPDAQTSLSLEGHESGVQSVAFSSDGRLLASGSSDKTIKLWTMPDGRMKVTLTEHEKEVRCVAFSPDGKWLASGSGDKTIKLWSLPDVQLHTTLEGHSGTVTSVAFSPDGMWLASGSVDSTIMLWTLPEGKLETSLFDPATMDSSSQAMQYRSVNIHGHTIIYTLACGSPIPPGATCTCNCVPGTIRVPVPRRPASPDRSPRTGGGMRCTCDKVCTCVPVYICQAHRLLNDDRVIQLMAEELLLLMGTAGLPYMRWAASEVSGNLRHRIKALIDAIQHDAAPDPARWPEHRILATYLDHDDPVTSLMAAQLILQNANRQFLTASLLRRSQAILAANEARHQAIRAKVDEFAITMP